MVHLRVQTQDRLITAELLALRAIQELIQDHHLLADQGHMAVLTTQDLLTVQGLMAIPDQTVQEAMEIAEALDQDQTGVLQVILEEAGLVVSQLEEVIEVLVAECLLAAQVQEAEVAFLQAALAQEVAVQDLLQVVRDQEVREEVINSKKYY